MDNFNLNTPSTNIPDKNITTEQITLKNANTNSNITRSQTVENNPKIPSPFVINISRFTQFTHREITETVQNDFGVAAESDKIKINVQTQLAIFAHLLNV